MVIITAYCNVRGVVVMSADVVEHGLEDIDKLSGVAWSCGVFC